MEAYPCPFLHISLAFLRLGTWLVRGNLGEPLSDGARAQLAPLLSRHIEPVGGRVPPHAEHFPGRTVSLCGRDVAIADTWPAAIAVFIWFEGFPIKLHGARLDSRRVIARSILSYVAAATSNVLHAASRHTSSINDRAIGVWVGRVAGSGAAGLSACQPEKVSGKQRRERDTDRLLTLSDLLTLRGPFTGCHLGSTQRSG